MVVRRRTGTVAHADFGTAPDQQRSIPLTLHAAQHPGHGSPSPRLTAARAAAHHGADTAVCSGIAAAVAARCRLGRRRVPTRVVTASVQRERLGSPSG